MAKKIEDLLAGKEWDVIDSLRRMGISATMEQYGLRNHNSFLAWLRHITPEGFYPSKLKGMTGGKKALWLRNNRDFVLQCVDIWGKDFVIENLNIGEDTLGELIAHDKSPIQWRLSETRQGKTSMDKAVIREFVTKQDRQDTEIKILKEQLFEVKKEIRELEDLYGQFTETVTKRIGTALIMPLVQRLTHPDRPLNLTPKNDLSLDDLFDIQPDPPGKLKVAKR